MQGIEKYSSYVDSGEKWIGEIPSSWELKRLGTWFTERRTKVSDKDYSALSVTKNGVVPQLANAAKTNDGDNRKLVCNGDFVINSRSDRKGSSGIAFQDGSVSLINIVMEPKGINPIYCNYLLKSNGFIEEYYRNGHGIVADLWTTRYDEMKNIKIALPSESEQTAIAKFLDEKTEKIDQSIAQKEQLIALLKERKQILIQQAVTKGLNPDTPLKDSGIDWIGDIPEHWEVKKMTHITKMLVDGTHFSPKSHEEGPYKYVTAKNIKEKGFDFSNLTYVTQKDHDDIYPRCPVAFGDVLYIKDGATAGIAMVNDLEEEFSLLSSVALIKPIKTIISSEFLSLYLNSEIIRGFIQTQIVGGALTRLTLELISRFKVIVPSTYEQSKIVNFFIQESSKIDESIGLQERQIEQLKEYKSVLIDSAVTGKIKVC